MANWDNIGNEEEISLHEEETQEVKQPEVAEVKMSKFKVGIVVIAMLLGLIILILTLRGCSVSKEVKNDQNIQSTETENKENINITTNGGEEDVNNSKNSTTFEESNSDREENSNSVKNEVVNKSEKNNDTEEDFGGFQDEDETNKGSNMNNNQQVNEDNHGLERVAEPSLSNAKTSTAMVSSKNVYKLNETSYAYAVNLVILTGENTTINVEYFCPRKTYDAIALGDSLNVEYQTDSFGLVSISSVSR